MGAFSSPWGFQQPQAEGALGGPLGGAPGLLGGVADLAQGEHLQGVGLEGPGVGLRIARYPAHHGWIRVLASDRGTTGYCNA